MDITLVLVTLLSILVAAVMTAFAWRLAQEERRREQARISALSAEIHLEDWPLRDTDATASGVRLSGDLFSGAPEGRHPSRAILAVAAVMLIAGSIAVVAVAAAVLRARANAPAAAPTPTHAIARPPATAGALPLELTALTHDRDGDRLIVRGVIRNPSAEPTVDRLAAVVSLFGHDGEPLGNGHAVIDAPALAPGSESPFVVSIPNAAGVARYRISFRTDDSVIPHVDRRGRPIAQAKEP